MASTYERGYSFAGFQSNQPQRPLPAQQLDIELDSIARAIATQQAQIQALRPGGGPGLPAIDLPIAGRSLKVNLLSTPAIPQIVLIEQFKQELGIGSGGGLPDWNDVQNKPVFGNAAQRNVGASTGTVAAGDDPRIVGALQAAQNGNDIPNKALFRSALGLGAAAVLGVGTAAGTVAAGDDSRLVNALTKTGDASGTSVTEPGGAAKTLANALANKWGKDTLEPNGFVIDTYNSYGVRADGSDQYQKIASALAFAGGLIAAGGFGGAEVRLPRGVIVISQHVGIPSGVVLTGAGGEATILTSTNTNDSIVYIGPNTLYAGCRNLGVKYPGGIPYSAAANGFDIRGYRGTFINIRAYNCAWGIHIFGGSNNLFTDYVVDACGLGCLYNEGTTNQNPDGSYIGAIDNFFFNGRLTAPASTAYSQLGTIRLTNNCEGLHMCGLSALGGKYGLIIASVSNTHGRRPQFMWFHGCMFDSHVRGSQLDNFSQSRFTDCWIAGAGYQDGAGANTDHQVTPGFLIGSSCFDLTFATTYVNSNAGAGVKINGAQDTSFIGCTFVGNGKYGDAQHIDFTGDGLIVTGGCRFYQTLNGVGDGAPTTYSLVIRPSATGVIISSSNARGCIVSNQTSGVVKIDTASTIGF